MSLSTLIAVIVQSETPHKTNAVISDMLSVEREVVSSLAMNNGCATDPTRRSETARLQSIATEVERIERVLIMAANTKALPVIDMSIRGTLQTQFTTVNVFREP